jgi:hypothetical protein
MQTQHLQFTILTAFILPIDRGGSFIGVGDFLETDK